MLNKSPVLPTFNGIVFIFVLVSKKLIESKITKGKTVLQIVSMIFLLSGFLEKGRSFLLVGD